MIRIYGVIDDIWGCDHHYIFGDFIYSLIKNNSRGPKLSITRDDYINKINQGRKIRSLLGISEYKYITNHQKLLIGLRLEMILVRVIITNKTEETFSRLIIYKLFVGTRLVPYLGISRVPYKLLHIGHSYLTIISFRDYIETLRKKHTMVGVDLSYVGCIAGNKLGFIVRKVVLDKYKILFEIELIKELKALGYDSYSSYANDLTAKK